MKQNRAIGDLTLAGQVQYEQSGGKLLDQLEIRLFQAADPQERNREFLCVESSDSGEEAWYRIDGVSLAPVSPQGVERPRP